MPNLPNTTRLPLRTSMTNKSKTYALTKDQVERKTQALEGGLNKRNLTMRLDQTKATIDKSRRYRSQEIPASNRDKPIVKPSIRNPMIKCGQCETEEAKMKCLECAEIYCPTCFSHFHLRGALQRHQCILLSPFSTETRSLVTDIDLAEYDETLNKKTNVASFQQSFLQWRENNLQKSEQIRRKHGLISPVRDRMEYSTKLPQIDSHSSKTNSEENILSKSSRTTQPLKTRNLSKKDQSKLNVLINVYRSHLEKTNSSNEDLLTTQTTNSEEMLTVPDNWNNNENNLEQERPVTHISAKSSSRPNSLLIKKDSTSSRPNSVALAQPSLRSLLTTKSTDELEAIVAIQLDLSRPSSSTSEKLPQPAHLMPLETTSNTTDGQPILTHQTIHRHLGPTLEQTAIDLTNPSNTAKDQSSTHVLGVNSTTTTPGRSSPFSFSNFLNKAIRLNSSSSIDTGDGGFFTDVLPRHTIPSSPPPLPPPILECSSSNEWKHTLENQSNEPDQTLSKTIPLPKLSIKSLSRMPSKDLITRDEGQHQTKSHIDNDSRSGSSLSSSSLPVSVASSKPNFDSSKTQSSASSASSTSTIKNSSSSSTSKQTSFAIATASSPTALKETSSTTATEPSPTASKETSSTSKEPSSGTMTATSSSTLIESSSVTATTTTAATSPPKKTSSSTSTPESILQNPSRETEPTNPIVTENKELVLPSDADESLEESIQSLNDKSSSDVKTNEPIEPNETTALIREGNITENDLRSKKTTRRRHTTTSDESSRRRKLEFSVGDGLKWQEASVESMSSIEPIPSKQSSTIPSPRSLTPSNSKNTKFAEQFSKYDNDDGRSSRTYQNINDEECYNQLHQELCSELDLIGSDEDALLNEQILKLLQGFQRPLDEKGSTTTIDNKLRENETVHQLPHDNELLIHE